METIKILLTGDFCPVFQIEKLALEGRHNLIFNDFLPEFEVNDLNIIDLECPLVDHGIPIRKTGPSIKASPSAVDSLRYAGVNLAALANNHIRDYGNEGIIKTIQLCNHNGIMTVGAGENPEAAVVPFRKNIKTKFITVFNFTENEWSVVKGNNATANPFSVIRNFAEISQAKNNGDIVIVVFHGGNEFYELPSPRLKETLRFFVDAGASAVISHHPHVFSGYEIYKNVPIFYSLGNFCYPSSNKNFKGWHFGYAVRLLITDSIAFEIIPFSQNLDGEGIKKLDPYQEEHFNVQLNSLNQIISDNKILKEKFDSFCTENAFRYDLLFEPYRNKLLAFMRKEKFLPAIMSKRKKRLFLNIIRCEAHRDLIINYLEDFLNEKSNN